LALNVGFALTPGPDGRQWVAWQVTDGQMAVTFPGINPDDIEDFAEGMAKGLKDAGAHAARANSGLLVPGFNIDPDMLKNLQQQQMPANGTSKTPT
jgi:hypothetical protein